MNSSTNGNNGGGGIQTRREQTISEPRQKLRIFYQVLFLISTEQKHFGHRTELQLLCVSYTVFQSDNFQLTSITDKDGESQCVFPYAEQLSRRLFS